MIELSDRINRKKQETMKLEKDNRDLSQKYEEITKLIKEKEQEIAGLQNEISQA